MKCRMYDCIHGFVSVPMMARRKVSGVWVARDTDVLGNPLGIFLNNLKKKKAPKVVHLCVDDDTIFLNLLCLEFMKDICDYYIKKMAKRWQ